MRVVGIDLIGKANDFSGEGFVQRRDIYFQRLAVADIWYGPFRHGDHQAQQIILRKMAERGIALGGGSSRGKQRAGVGVNLRHDSVKRRSHARVGEQSFVLVQRGFGGEQGLFGGGQGILRR